ncbi:xanthine dehydrogenase family protein molybdopterin-binding subunit [Thermodesulfobacteriota bacterium]
MMAEYSVIGKRVPRVDALAKVTGSALYSADINLPNMLFGMVLWSPYAHALIHRLDTNRAQALNGVIEVITHADVPGKRDNKPYLDPMTSCLAGDRVIFAGQPIAAVAAINTEIAEEALSLIEVDYEELTPIVDVLEAMKPDAPLVHPGSRTLNLPDKDTQPSNIFWQMKNTQGDVDAGFREADIVLKNTFRTQTVHHGYIEPRATVASVDTNGKVTVWSDNQGIFEVRELIAEFMDLPLNYVKVIPVEIGGAFGGKSHQVISPLCVLLSIKSGKPVKIVMTREEVFKTTRPAPASVITIEAGVKKDGDLTAVTASMIYDYGALRGMAGMSEVPPASLTGLGPYRIPNLKIECNSVYTNKTPSGPYRGPKASQAAFAVESQMDLIARALNMDPLEFRLKNIASEGDPMPNGKPLPKVGFKETIEKMQGYLKEQGLLEGENRGRGIACGFWPPSAGPAAAHINVNTDGTIALSIGSVDISGTRTSLAQLVAEELGIPFEKVTVVTGDTDTAPYSIMSVGSMITRSLSVPICEACQDVKNQLCRIAASQLKTEESDVEFVHGHVRIKGMSDKSISLEDLAGQTFGFQGKGPITGRGSNKGSRPAPVLAVGMADIEVDRETGKIKILSYAAAQDVGRAINPTMVEGQIQGAIVQGIGWSLTENHISEKGVMQNATLLDYRIPTAVDVPYIDTMLVEVDSKSSPYGIRGVGEPPMVPTLAVMANAVHNATGVRLKELPMDPEAIIRALRKEKA